MARIFDFNIRLNEVGQFILCFLFQDKDIFKFTKVVDASHLGFILKDIMQVLKIEYTNRMSWHDALYCNVKYDLEDIIIATHPDEINICKKLLISADGEDWLYLNGGE